MVLEARTNTLALGLYDRTRQQGSMFEYVALTARGNRAGCFDMWPWQIFARTRQQSWMFQPETLYNIYSPERGALVCPFDGETVYIYDTPTKHFPKRVPWKAPRTLAARQSFRGTRQLPLKIGNAGSHLRKSKGHNEQELHVIAIRRWKYWKYWK